SGTLPYRHSFPTRRSSDLAVKFTLIPDADVVDAVIVPGSVNAGATASFTVTWNMPAAMLPESSAPAHATSVVPTWKSDPDAAEQIGRASCRERVEIAGGGG